MRKFLFALFALITVNVVSAQDYLKTYSNQRQKLVDGKWGTKEYADAYVKVNYDGRIHIHDEYGIHLDVHEKDTTSVLKPEIINGWEKVESIFIVDKDYNSSLSIGSEIRIIIWRKSNGLNENQSAAYTIVTKNGEFLYAITKQELYLDGILDEELYKPF